MIVLQRPTVEGREVVWALEAQVPFSARLVLVALVTIANEEHVARVRIDQLVSVSGIAHASTRRALAELTEAKLIEVEAPPKARAQYGLPKHTIRLLIPGES